MIAFNDIELLMAVFYAHQNVWPKIMAIVRPIFGPFRPKFGPKSGCLVYLQIDSNDLSDIVTLIAFISIIFNY